MDGEARPGDGPPRTAGAGWAASSGGIEWVQPASLPGADTDAPFGASPAAAWPLADVVHHGPDAGPPHRRRAARRIWLAFVVVLVLAVGAAGGWYLLRPAAPIRLTYGAATIDNLRQLTVQADAGLHTYARTNLGVSSPHARCYYTRSASGAATDIDSSVWCGPVLFFDGTITKTYLQFDLTARPPTRAGHVLLDVATTPASPKPGALPPGVDFVRPDHHTPPRGSDGLSVPVPPPASPTLFEYVSAYDISELPPAPTTAYMGSRNFSLKLVSSGYLSSIGHEADERSAAPGYRLFALDLDLEVGELADPDLVNLPTGFHPDVSLTADGTATHSLSMQAAIGVDRFFVVSVPSATKNIDVVMKDAGFTQRMSAVTGETAAGNIVVLNTRHAFDSRPAAGNAVATVSAYGQTFTAHLHVTVYGFGLGFFAPTGPHPTDPTHAYLYVSACYSSTDFVDPGCHTFRGTDLQLTPDGGRPIVARDVGQNDVGYCVFEVPATFRSGTLAVVGTESSGDGWSMSITQPYLDRFSL